MSPPEPPGSRPSPDLIADRYQPLDVLGEGAAGRVLRCRDLQLEREVAVKFLGGRGPLSDPLRFQEEAQILASLRHENILEIFDFGLHEGSPFLVIELLEGGNLKERLDEEPLSHEEAVPMARALLEALVVGHSRGVLHRDVKPENVLLTPEGAPRLADFGLAKRSASGVKTRTGVVLGTPEFMAPELFEGEAFSPASDLYAWGCLCYALVNGGPPYRGSIAEVIRLAQAGALRVGKARGALQEVIMSTVRPDPRSRADADELRDILSGKSSSSSVTRAVTLEPSTAGQATVAVRGPTSALPSRRSRWIPAGIGLLLFSLAGVGLYWWSTGPPPVVTKAASNPAHRETADRWRRRIKRRELLPYVKALHLQVDGERGPIQAEKYQERMFDHRKGKVVNPKVEALRENRDSLPHRADLMKDRAVLEAALVDSTIPFRVRQELIEALDLLGELDAYYTAWGEEPPYRIRELVGVACSVEVLELRRTDREKRLALRDRPLSPGRHLVFYWVEERDATYPCLMPNVNVPSHDQKISWRFATLSRGWNPADHREARSEFVLEEPAPGLELELTVGQFCHPDSLRLNVNGHLYALRADLERTARGSYFTDTDPEYRLRVRPPIEAWKKGANTVVLTARQLLGLPYFNGTDVHRVELVIPPPSG